MRSDLVSPRSFVVDVDGPVHVADYGGAPNVPTLVCVHGLGNSHVTWRPFAQALAGSHRILAVDLPGHGRLPRAGRSVSVAANQDLLDRVLQRLDSPAVVVGHSMGASIAVLQAAYRPDTVAALVLLAPPVPRRRVEPISPALAAHVLLCAWPSLARTALGFQLRRLGPEEYVRRRLQLTCASEEAIDEATRRLLVELVAADCSGEGHAAFVEAARSVGLLVARGNAYTCAIEAVQAPTLVLHGALDRILPEGGLRRLAALQPLWQTSLLDGVGHSPHLEAPVRTAELVREFIDTLGATASRPLVPADPQRDVHSAGPTASGGR